MDEGTGGKLYVDERGVEGLRMMIGLERGAGKGGGKG
jgi:hypothetical protein